jgi:hypothetical protein
MPTQALIPSEKAIGRMRSLVPNALPGQIYLFQGDRETLAMAMQELIDRFALRGKVSVITGANRISFEHLPLLLHERADEIYEIADRILVSRAETCHQMLDVLRALGSSLSPLVITDMLDSFYEEDLSDREVETILSQCLGLIYKLSENIPVLISASNNPGRPQLIKSLEPASDMHFYFEAAPVETFSAQLDLFKEL